MKIPVKTTYIQRLPSLKILLYILNGALIPVFLSIAEADNSPGLRAIRQEIYKQLSVSAPSYEDAEAVKILVHAIGKRAARFAGLAVGAVVIETGRLSKTAPATAVETIQEGVAPIVDTAPAELSEDDVIDIGVDGSLVEFYPGFEDYMREAFRDIVEIGEAGEKRIRIGIAKDGSGVGAALIALVAAKAEKAVDTYGLPPMKEGLSS